MVSANTVELLPAQQDLPLRQSPLGPGVVLGQLGNTLASLTLSRLAVRARVSGPVAAVEVLEAFANSYTEPLELVYLFPLSPNASVSRFRAQIGQRLIEGQVLEREVAAKTYARASRGGFLSSLFANETAPIFSVSLGLVPPGTAITVELAYTELLESVYGNFQFRFPFVVSTRLLPGAALGTTAAPMTTEAHTMMPGLTLGSQVACSVQIETSGLTPQRLACSQSSVLHRLPSNDLGVELAKQGELQIRDFVLAYRFGTERSPQVILRHTQKHFYLNVSPPLVSPPATVPRDLILVMDISDNATAPRFEVSKHLANRLLSSLTVGERFALVGFNHTRTGYKQGVFCPQEEVPQALSWMQELRPTGRADLKDLLELLLTIPSEPGRTLVVALVACGHVGNEPELYTMMTFQPVPFRVLTAAIGPAVNQSFLRRLAVISRGGYTFLGSDEAVLARSELMIEDSRQPLITDLLLGEQGLGVMQETCTPLPIPGLGGQHPVTVLGLKSGQGAIEVRGRTFSGHPWAEATQPAPCQNPALGFVWAQQKTLEMLDELKLTTGPRASRLRQIVLDLSQEYRLLTDYTAFVALETQAGGSGPVQGHLMPSLYAADWSESNPVAEGAAKALERARERRILLPPSATPEEVPPEPPAEEPPKVRPGLVMVGEASESSPGLKPKALIAKGGDGKGKPKIKIKPGSPINNQKVVGQKTFMAKGGRGGAALSKPMLPRPGEAVLKPAARQAPSSPVAVVAPLPVEVEEPRPSAPSPPAVAPTPPPPPVVQAVPAPADGELTPEEQAKELLHSNADFCSALKADLRALYQAIAKTVQGAPGQPVMAYLERILRRTQPLQPHSTVVKEVYRVGVLCYQAMQASDPQALPRLQVWVQGYAKLF